MFESKAIRPNKYGINDRLPCPNCKMTMLLGQRTLHSTLTGFEVQTFNCKKCGNEIKRIVDVDCNTPD
jgi:hypothetical protein